MTSPATIQPMVPHTRSAGNLPGSLTWVKAMELPRPNVGMKHSRCISNRFLTMPPSPLAANPGTASNAAPPSSSNTPITFSEGKNRSATSPRNSGATIAAIGALP